MLLLSLASAAAGATEVMAQPMLHPMFADVALYGLRVKVAPSPGLPWRALERDLTERLRETGRRRARSTPVEVLQPADPRQRAPGTLVLEVEARIAAAAELGVGSRGYVMAFTIRPIRADPNLPPSPGFPGAPEIVYAPSVAKLIDKAEASGALARAMDRVGL